MSRNYLFVVAHSDDELLGCGATIQKLTERKDNVSVCCLTHDAPTRESDIYATMMKTHKALGIVNTYVGKATALELDKYDRIDHVRFVEDAIRDSKCDVIFTHSMNDLHKDHVMTAQYAFEAARLPQRLNENVKPITEILSFEVPCSSAWGYKPFSPNKFVCVEKEQLENKINLISMYDNVIRNSPHPRSRENIFALAKYRGSQSGFEYAEAFNCAFSTVL